MIHNVIYMFVLKDDEILRAIVCTTNYKYIKAKDGKPEMVKTGVHMFDTRIKISVGLYS